MLKKVFLIIAIVIFFSCKSNKLTSPKENITQVQFNNQDFNLEQFKGIWFTNSESDKSNFAIFQDDYYVRYNDNRHVKYELKKDSIFIYFKRKIAKGRLINLNETEVEILWGTKEPKERIKYYR